MHAMICLIPTVSGQVMNEWSVASCKNGFIARTMCIYCETVLWNSFVKSMFAMILYRNFQVLYLSSFNHAILNLIKENWKRTYARWFTALGTIICGDLREEGGDCKECHRTPHRIIMKLVQQVGLSHTLAYCTFCSMVYRLVHTGE